jgi:CBS domain containing-hemolysin-like protein
MIFRQFDRWLLKRETFMQTIEESAISLVAVILLLVTNAFFVAAEFALVKARGFRIESLAEEGGFAAKLTLTIQRDLEAYLAACQLGITMASLGLGWVGEPAVAALLKPLFPIGMSEESIHTISFLLGFTIFSSLHIVVGEQVPKTYAIRKPEAISVLCAIPLRVFYVLLFPLNWILNKASRGLLSLLGVEEASHADVLTGTEIRGLVSTSAEHGEMGLEKAEMIQNLFRFDERAVQRVMIPRLECQILRLDQKDDANIATMRETRHSRFPVVESGTDNLVGMVLMKDLVDAMLAGNSEPWTDLKSFCREPLIVPETLRIPALFDTMRAEKAHMACVIDEYGSFVGLITLEDLLEEIVGDIADESDEFHSDFPIKKTDTGWVAHGLASLADIERETGYVVEDGFDANTLSGLFMNRLQRIPQEGNVVADGDYRFVVERMKNHHVEFVVIEKLEVDTNQQDRE